MKGSKTVKLGTRRRTRTAGLAAGLLSLGLVAAACGGGTSDGGGTAGGGNTAGGGSSEPIQIGYINWNEDVATTYLWKHILEERGYTVELQQLDASAIFTGMAGGENPDLFLDTWLPSTHKQYWSEHKGSLKKYATWYEGATLELSVPTYMNNVNTIGDLKKVAGKLDGTITGIGPSAGETQIVKEEIMPAYGLKQDLTYETSSSTAMLAALKKATDNQNPIVVALWHPHWAYQAFDIKDLKDPKNAWPGGEKLYVTGRNDFGQDYPKVAQWLSNYKLKPADLQSLSNAVVNNAEGQQAREEAAAQWAQSHQDLINQWVGSSSGSSPTTS